MADDYFDAKLALNLETGNVVAGASAQIYSITDTAFANPLDITDLSGIPLGALIASPTGIYPPFKVVSGDVRVVAKSGSMFTPITSVDGSRGTPGEPGPPGEGLPSATSLPDGYAPITASGVWTAAPAATGGGGGTGSSTSIYEVYWVTGSGWPVLPASAPVGVKSRWFLGGPTPYTGATWAGVLDFYFASGA